MAGKKSRTFEYRKGQEIKVRIIDIGMRGEGIGKLEDGYTVFIKDAVIGDYVRAGIMKANKSYAYAHLEQILQASPHRVEPLCPVARQCGGCQLQALSYEQELVYKENKVRSDLIRIGGFPEEEIDAVMEPIVGMQDNPNGPWRYRNKAQVPVGYSGSGKSAPGASASGGGRSDRNGRKGAAKGGSAKNNGGPGRVVAGFYAGRTHSIIPMTDCMLGEEINREIINRVLTYMEIHKVPPYDEESGKGLVRHILIRSGKFSGQIMVCLVVNGESLPLLEDFLTALHDDTGMVRMVIELKSCNVRSLLSMVDSIGVLDRVDFISFSQGLCGQLIAYGFGYKTFYLNGTLSPQAARERGYCGIDYSYQVLDGYPYWINEAQAYGLVPYRALVFFIVIFHRYVIISATDFK